ncbi:MAG TPA: acyl-CoA dehydrogenase family protein, partial [Stellaceae bacterium]|nr:acyl-CoA dehydrogenase family protein [Stellaceae bacterium]
MTEIGVVSEKIRAISGEFAADRRERQRRRELAPADFARLREAGFPLTGVPVDQGGVWESLSRSARPICDMLRVLAHGDSSVALVCAMHPSVLNFWIATPEVPAPFAKAWEEQRRSIFGSVCEGAWWGTIASEPGASGDLSKSKATARREPSDGGYRLSGQKNMGSGSGITSFMITVAIPEGEATPDLFVLDMLKVPWDGSAGVTLTAAWDGQGMTATQSHAMSFKDYPATRIAWPGQLASIIGALGGLVQCCFTAVIVGVAEIALDTAREQVARRRDELRAYERLEWARAELEGWLIAQAYEGMLRAIEEGRDDA